MVRSIENAPTSGAVTLHRFQVTFQDNLWKAVVVLDVKYVDLNFHKELSMRIIIIEILLIAFIGSVAPVSGLSAEFGWNEVGVRMGIQEVSRHEDFRSYEAFAVCGLPWDWRASSGWGLTPQLTTSLGALDGAGETGIIGSMGFAFILDKQGLGISTDIGTSANFLNRRRFGTMDFGSIFQFVSHIGINYRFNSGIKIGYRIQHMSDGGIFYPKNAPNPGLNMHILGISYVF